MPTKTQYHVTCQECGNKFTSPCNPKAKLSHDRPRCICGSRKCKESDLEHGEKK